jgi:SNF family Na+-dependent transporter
MQTPFNYFIQVVYFTAIAPYVLILIFLVRGALLEGSLEGIKFYMIPTWNKLAEPKVGNMHHDISIKQSANFTIQSGNC